MVSVSRRQIITGCIAGVPACVGYAHYIEPGWLEVNVRKVKLRARSLARPIRVLHLSDLHASEFVNISYLESAFELGMREKPDVICLTGDYVTAGERHDQPAYEKALRRLSSTAPTVAVLGNHDGVWAPTKSEIPVGDLLRKAGCQLLLNQSTYLDVAGSRLRFVGLGDHWLRQVNAPLAFANAKCADATILLNHNPDAKTLVRGMNWDLMLCGHTHGGQLIVPRYGTPYAPVEDKRYVAGLLPYDKALIHVTKGVGTVHGYRFNCRPEVSLLIVS